MSSYRMGLRGWVRAGQGLHGMKSSSLVFMYCLAILLKVGIYIYVIGIMADYQNSDTRSRSSSINPDHHVSLDRDFEFSSTLVITGTPRSESLSLERTVKEKSNAQPRAHSYRQDLLLPTNTKSKSKDHNKGLEVGLLYMCKYLIDTPFAIATVRYKKLTL